MYLYKHPKETKENKVRAHRLIQAWSRPIFNNESDFHSLSREDREQRDQELMSRSKRMRNSLANESPSPTKKGSDKGPQPGDKGWVPRARVPMPSVKDYVNRPKPSPDVDTGSGRGSSKKVTSRLELLQRSFMEKKRASKGSNRACKISIEGRRM
jgi:transcription factor SPN1